MTMLERLAYAWTSTIVASCATFLLRAIARRRMHATKNSFDGEEGVISAVLLTVFLSALVMIYLIVFSQEFANPLFILLLSIAAFAHFAILVLGYSSLSGYAEARQQNQTYQQQLLFYSSYLRSREADFLSGEILRHDQEQHFVYLLSALEEGRYKEGISYLKTILSTSINAGQFPSGNFAIDSLLNYKEPQFKDAQIELKSNFCVPEYLEINDVNLCVVLGNLLDNALEATKSLSSDKRWIELSVRYVPEGGNLCIIIRNPYQGSLKTGGLGGFRSTKSVLRRRGLGLYSVRQALKKYDGILQTKLENDSFTAIVLMYGDKA
jgi:signal transduction histidine kinase